MTIVNRGKETHQLVKKDETSKEYMVNKKPHGCKTLTKLIAKLSGPPSKAWPVQLKEGVNVTADGTPPVHNSKGQ